MDSPAFRSCVTNVQRFLFILAWAHRQNPGEFETIIAIEGRSRKYFATDPKVLLTSGASVNPRQIPDSPFWVVTNSSTAKKCEMLASVFQLLGYDPEDVNAMIRMAIKA
jgi:negative modulator of initiation of replication